MRTDRDVHALLRRFRPTGADAVGPEARPTRLPRVHRHGRVTQVREATVDGYFPFYWAAGVDPVACGLVVGPPATPPGRSRFDDLDLDLVLVVYGVLVESCACGICGAPLGPATGVRRGRFTARMVVTTRCRGPRRHRHRARIREHGGELRMAPLRPA